VKGAVIRTSYEYNALGVLAKTSRPYFLAGGTAQWTTFSHDALGSAASRSKHTPTAAAPASIG
jgi:hypothetical protein